MLEGDGGKDLDDGKLLEDLDGGRRLCGGHV